MYNEIVKIKERRMQMKDWVCPKCGHEVLSREKPQAIKWTDGHVCYFVEDKRGYPQTEEVKINGTHD